VRALRDAELIRVIRQVHNDNLGVYGARKIHAELKRKGHSVARCTVERLMRAEGLSGIKREKTRKTTIGEGAETPRPADLVERQFVAQAPNQLWVADLTYIRTFAGWAYAGFVIDVFSRMVVGWQVSTSLRTDLALDALNMGLWSRQRAGQDVAGLTHHSDRGVQYRALRYTERLAEADAVASVGSKGDSYDKACVSHCTSWRGLGGNSVSDGASLPGGEPRVAGCRRFEEPDVFVVGLVRDEQSGAVPVLDRGLVHAEPRGELVDGEQASRVESFEVAGQVVCAA
jgi:hypothetical protein